MPPRAPAESQWPTPAQGGTLEWRVARLEMERAEQLKSDEAWRDEVRKHHALVAMTQALIARDLGDGAKRMDRIDDHLKANDADHLAMRADHTAIKEAVAELKHGHGVLGARIKSSTALQVSRRMRWTAISGATTGGIGIAWKVCEHIFSTGGHP